MKRCILLQASPLLSGVSGLAWAQAGNQPSRPIKYIMPVATGGSSDMSAQALSEQLGKVLGQALVVENQGRGGVIATYQDGINVRRP